MKIKNLILAVILLTSVSSLAEIREAKSMKEILSEVTLKTAVVFDLDNTVIRPYQTIGTDQFFGFLKQKAVAGGMADLDAAKWAINQVTPIAPVVPVQAVESLTPKLISYLQAHNVMVFALTARPPNWARGTLGQLRSVGVSFSETSPLHGKVTQLSEGNLFAGGVIFMPIGNKKGPTLLSFLKTMKPSINNVVFVDDNPHNIENVEETFKNVAVRNTNFRYGGADPIAKAFSPEIAEVEWTCYEYSQKIISDDHAKAILSGEETCESR